MTAPGDPLDRFIRGIVAKWVSLSATTFTGIRGPFRDEAPSNNSAHPYAVIKDASCDSLAHTCESEVYQGEFEFRVYAKSPEDAATEIAKVDGVFSSLSLSLTLTGVEFISMRLMSPSYTKPDEGVWYGGLRYRFQISRPRIA